MHSKKICSSLALVLLLSLSIAKASPRLYEQQFAFTLKNLTPFLSFCLSEHSTFLGQEERKTLSDLTALMKSHPVSLLELSTKNASWFYSTKNDKWSKEASEIPDLRVSQSNVWKTFRKPPSVLIARSAALLTNSLLTKHNLGNSSHRDSISACIEANVLNHSESVMYGVGEDNISLTAIRVESAHWPSFSRIVLSDGEGFWDLTTELANVSKPTQSQDEVQSVEGIAIAGCTVSQHLVSKKRYFILPVFQYALQVDSSILSAIIPGEYIRISFEKKWDGEKKLLSIIPSSLQFTQVKATTPLDKASLFGFY